MKRIGYVKMIYELTTSLEADFYFQSAHVQTIPTPKFIKMFPKRFEAWKIESEDVPGQRPSEFGYLIIEVTVGLNSYDSLGEGSAKIRPQLLVIMGILSFLTNMVLIPADSFSIEYRQVKNHISQGRRKNKIVADNHDLTSDLNKIFDKISIVDGNTKVLFYSLFERWRKAVFMETKSEESLLFIDEAVLAYVHILEVLSEEYKSSHNTKVDLEKAVLLNELSVMSKQDQAKNTQKISKLINKIAGLKLSLKVKIFHMLEELGLRNPKSEAIIERFIDHRNSIAHGRKDIYQDQLVFPLKPFFSFIKDVDEDIKAIKILAAQVISKHFNLTSWKLEWEELMVIELVPIEQIKIFLKEKKHEAISLKDFFNGKIEDIFPLVFSHYYLRKKLDFEELENAISPFLNFPKATKNICEHLFDVAVVLADSTKPKIAQKAKDIVKTTDANRWGYYSNVRDVIKRHEYFGVKLVWFESWLEERANRL